MADIEEKADTKEISPPIAAESDADSSIEKEGSVDAEQAMGGEVTATMSAKNAQNFPDGGARAWMVAAGATGAIFCTFGYANAFGVLQEYYQTHQLSHKTPSEISWIGSLQIFFLFMGNAVGGPLFDQLGAKVIYIPSITYVISVMMTSLCKEYWQFMLAQGVLGGLSMGMTMAPSMASVGQYFFKKRGAAMGLAVAGSSVGGVIFPIALTKLINNPSIGFGWGIRILGFLILAVIAPSALAIRARLPPRKGQFFLPTAFKEPTYVLVCAAYFLAVLGIFMPIFYLPSFAVGKGMSSELASYILSILNGASFFGRVIPGVLGDKVGRYNVFSGAALCTGILVFCMQALNSNASIIVFSALYGFFSGAIVSGMSVVLAGIPKDPRNIGTYMGMGMAIVSVGALISPPIDGAFITAYKGYGQVSDFSGVMTVLSAAIVLGAKATTDKGLWAKV